MNAVLVHGDRGAQGYVVRWLAGSERVSEEAYETLVGDWKSIYVKAPKDALVKLRAQQASQPMSAIAREALDDPEFDVAAVKELGRIAGSGR